MRRDGKVMVFIRIILQQKGGARYLYSEGLFDYRQGAYGIHCISASGIAPGYAAGHGKLKAAMPLSQETSGCGSWRAPTGF
jgi:hypothetical protein